MEVSIVRGWPKPQLRREKMANEPFWKLRKILNVLQNMTNPTGILPKRYYDGDTVTADVRYKVATIIARLGDARQELRKFLPDKHPDRIGSD